MATEIVVTEAQAVLTQPMAEEGEALVRHMRDREIMGLTAAFWLYMEEGNRWRLHLAAPLVGEKGPLVAYSLILDALNALPGRQDYGLNAIELGDITAIDEGDTLVRLLHTVYPHGVNTGVARARQAWIGGRHFAGIYIYLLTPQNEKGSSTD